MLLFTFSLSNNLTWGLGYFTRAGSEVAFFIVRMAWSSFLNYIAEPQIPNAQLCMILHIIIYDQGCKVELKVLVNNDQL